MTTKKENIFYTPEEEKYRCDKIRSRELAQDQDRDLLIKILCILCGFIILIGFLSIYIYFSNMNFNYEVSKCGNMNSATGSGYDFTNRIEMNAKYNERCYYLINHPMARFNEVYGSSILGSIFMIFFMVMGYILYRSMRSEYKNKSEESYYYYY